MIQWLRWKSTTLFVRATGFCFLIVYLLDGGDRSFSPLWAGGYPIIAAAVAFSMVSLRLQAHFPRLNRYALYSGSSTEPLWGDEWAQRQTNYYLSMARNAALLYVPAEDGLICVPILWAGVTPVSALLGGLVFGYLHLASYTYMECIGKATIYALVCFFVLPHGILNVVAGHFTVDLIGFISLIAVRRSLRTKP